MRLMRAPASSLSPVARTTDWLCRTFELQDPAHARLLPMEGLRGMAVILVFLQHYCVQAELIGLPPRVTGSFAALFHSYGNFGVELFFVLSGYLIYGALVRRAPPFIVFMRRRIVRIYPAFLAVFCPVLLATFMFIPGRIPDGAIPAIRYIAANLFLVAGIVPMVRIVDVAWSLSYEMFFYIATGFLILGLCVGRLQRTARLVVLALLWATFLIGSLTQEWLPLRMMPFFAGMAFAEGMGGRVPGWAGWAPALGLAVLSTHRVGPVVGELIQTICFFLLCAVCFRSVGRVSQLMCWAPLRWLGNMSYSYYLVHGFIVRLSMTALAQVVTGALPPVAFWLLIVPLFAATLAGSALLFVGVEKPVSLR